MKRDEIIGTTANSVEESEQQWKEYWKNRKWLNTHEPTASILYYLTTNLDKYEKSKEKK